MEEIRRRPIRCRLGWLAAGAWLVLMLWSVPSAQATEYCLGGYISCQDPRPTLQAALDSASAHPGADVVRVGYGRFSSPGGFSYSDRGDPTNALDLRGTDICVPEACDHTVLVGGSTGGTLLNLGSSASVAPVEADILQLEVSPGQTGVRLGAGGSARLGLGGPGGAIGVVLDGRAGAPALLTGSTIGLSGVAIDVPGGYGTVDDTTMRGDIGIRSSGPGTVEVRGGQIDGRVGMSVTRARVGGTLIGGAGADAGIEVRCPDSASADAQLTTANVTIRRLTQPNGQPTPGGVGVRSTAVGGDGASCQASADLDSVAVSGFATALAAGGSAGTGAAPEPGIAGISAIYSDLYPGLVDAQPFGAVSAPPTSGNLSLDPEFRIPPGGSALGADHDVLLGGSPLIDAGNPAAPETTWLGYLVQPRHGRRDIGSFEYGFDPPSVSALPSPTPVYVGVPTEFSVFAQDSDSELLRMEFTIDGETVVINDREPRYRVLKTYGVPGTHVISATVRDPTGQTGATGTTFSVLIPEIQRYSLEMSRDEFRPASHRRRGGTTVSYYLLGSVPVRLTFTRAVYTKRHRFKRWRNLAGSITDAGKPGLNRIRLSGRLRGHPLKPGLFRLSVKPQYGRTSRIRFRILR